MSFWISCDGLSPSYDSNNVSTNVCLDTTVNKSDLSLHIVMITVLLNNINIHWTIC